MTWAEREAKLEEGNILVSRRSDPTNWDFFPGFCDGKEAFALNVGVAVTGLRVIDDEHLLVESAIGNFVLIGDDTRTMRIVKEEDFRQEADVPAVVEKRA
jgi:hypothetical protein